MVENTIQNRSGKILEAIVTIFILLVIIQTFLDDFSVIMGWAKSKRTILLFTNFFFDLFFTIEFLTRLYNGLSRKRAIKYLVHERGWIDFLASVPLLILSSSPSLLSHLFGGVILLGSVGMMNMLKLIKAIRIARILRLLRIIRIFRNIKNADSVMAQRHMAKIITISVTVIVFALIGYRVMIEYIDSVDSEKYFNEQRSRIVSYLSIDENVRNFKTKGIEKLEETVLVIKKDGKMLYTRYNKEYYKDNFHLNDYKYQKHENLEIFFDIRGENKIREIEQSWQNLFFFCLIIFIVIIYLLIYSPHFAITVSDPIHVMKRGMDENNYNLEVKIPNNYKDDDVFQLSRSYNENYLPLKDRVKKSDGIKSTDLKIDDIKDIFE